MYLPVEKHEMNVKKLSIKIQLSIIGISHWTAGLMQ
jgi:hypothetical protein